MRATTVVAGRTVRRRPPYPPAAAAAGPRRPRGAEPLHDLGAQLAAAPIQLPRHLVQGQRQARLADLAVQLEEVVEEPRPLEVVDLLVEEGPGLVAVVGGEAALH